MSGLKNVQRRWSDALSESRWDEVERMLADHYRAQGYEVDHVGTGNSRARLDGGIDLKLRKDGRYTVVQCKHWNAKQVPHNDVHELIGVMATEGAQAAILVTSGEFTPYARESAAKIGTIELVDGATLRQWLGPILPKPRTEGERRMEEFAGVVLDHVSDRLLRTSARPSRAVEVGLGLIVGKALAVGLFLLLMFVVVPRMFGAIFSQTLPRPPAASVPPPAAVSAPLGPSVTSPAAAAPAVSSSSLSPYQPVLRRHVPSTPIAEIGSADEMMSPEELEEWKRKNEESMRVLERRVPELQH